MFYVLLTMVAALVLFNVYASIVVLRSKLNDESQRRQLVFVWLLPALGAVIALHVLKPSRKSKATGDSEEWNMRTHGWADMMVIVRLMLIAENRLH